MGRVPIGNVYVDGLDVGDVGEESLQARRILGDEGFVALTVVVAPSTRPIVRPVHLSTRGFSDDPAAFDPVLGLVEDDLRRALADDGSTRTGCPRSSAGRWASGSPTPTPAVR